MMSVHFLAGVITGRIHTPNISSCCNIKVIKDSSRLLARRASRVALHNFATFFPLPHFFLLFSCFVHHESSSPVSTGSFSLSLLEHSPHHLPPAL
jgi:hypothetical protein